MNITAKEGITDARKLGMPKYIILGVQHLFAMFGATVLVPVLTGLSVSSTLLFAGIGTLVFHLVSSCRYQPSSALRLPSWAAICR